MNILITGATGMFGSAVVKKLAEKNSNHQIKALVRNPNKAADMGLDQLSNVELAVGDMQNPESLVNCLANTDRVFLVSPMMPGLDQMEINVIEAAKQQGVKHIFKLHGAVQHEDDDLSKLHHHSIQALKDSGLDWTLVSPNSVIETSLFPHFPA